MRNCIFIWLAILASSLLLPASGCASSPSESRQSSKVLQYGAMKPVMRQGQTEARVRLTDTVADSGAIGVGALEGLAGEITIVDGQVWVSQSIDNTLHVTGPDPLEADQATLLTLAHVNDWQTTDIHSQITGQAIETLIQQVAEDAGLDTAKPFPFVIEGQLTHIDLHVINGYCPIATDPATIDAQPWKLSNDQQVAVKLVGFYAPNAAGVMTHHGTSLHMHAVMIIEERTLAGHVDSVVIEPGMVLRLPMS